MTFFFLTVASIKQKFYRFIPKTADQSQVLLSIGIIFICFTSVGLKAQVAASTRAEIHNIKGLDDVLIKDINDIYCDSANYIWICDADRIVRYDGNHYKNISTVLYNGYYNLRFQQDDFGRLWIVSLDGSLGYIENDTVRNYKYNNIAKKLIYRAYFESLHFDKDSTLHIGTKGHGYYQIDKDGYIHEIISRCDSIYGIIAIDRKGYSPIICSTGESPDDFEYPYSFHYFDEFLNLIDRAPFQNPKRTYLSSLTKLEDNNYLYSAGNREIFHFDNKGIKKYISYDQHIIQAFIDSKGGIWLGTDNDGTHFFDSFLSLLNGDDPEIHLKGEVAAAVCEDQDQGIWLKSASSGVSLITAPRVKVFTEYPGLSDEFAIKAIYATDKYAYIASEAEINRVDRKGNIERLPPSPLLKKKKIDRYFRALYYDSINDCLWAGGARGQLFYWQKGKWQESEALSKERMILTIRKIVPSPEPGIICIIANERYLLMKNDTVIHNQRFPQQEIKDVAFTPDGKTWFATINGLGYLEDGILKYITRDHPLELKAPFYDLHYENGRLWFINDHRGYIDDKDEIHLISDIPGLYAFEDPYDGLWFPSCCNGLIHQRMNSSGSFESAAYTVSASLERSELNTSFAWGDSLFLGSTHGLFLTTKNELDTFKPAPETQIQQIWINGKKRSLKKHFNLAYNENFVQIDFTGIYYSPGKHNINYRYKLDGLRNEWVQSTRSTAQFTNLMPGDYSFILQSRIAERVYSKPVTLHFTIASPFWETWWFRILVVLITVGLILSFLRNRLRVEKKQSQLMIDKLEHEQKALRAQMNPHFIFNALGSIQQMVFNNESDNAVDHIALFAHLMRQVLELSKKELISLAEELELLNTYLELEFMRFDNRLQYKIDVSPEINVTKNGIPPLFLQPLAENALKHGLLKRKTPGGSMHIRVYRENEFIVVEVNDNGVGYQNLEKLEKVGTKHQSFGLSASRQRIKLFNMTRQHKMRLELTSPKPDLEGYPGTAVKIWIPDQPEYHISGV